MPSPLRPPVRWITQRWVGRITIPLRMLLPGGMAFALAMLVVRPAGSVYLPRALETSDERYGTIGLAFAYISWLYILAFCLLMTAVLGHVVARDDGALGHLVRGPEETAARPHDAAEPQPSASRRFMQRG